MGDFGNPGGPGRPRPKGAGHVYVPMPAAQGFYGTDGRSSRDQLIRQYGEVSVMHAEVAACIVMLEAIGILKKSEFQDLVQGALAAADLRRQRQAESGGRG